MTVEDGRSVPAVEPRTHWADAGLTWEQYSTALDIRIAWVYAAAPIGAGLSVFHLVAGLLQRWTGNEDLSVPLHSASAGLE